MYEREINMKYINEKLQEIISINNGHVTTKELKECGYSTYFINQLVNLKYFDKISRGKYLYKDSIDDEFKLIQQNNNKLIYSNETALYLHHLTDRSPEKHTVTTVSGYHLRNHDVKVYYVKEDLFKLGMSEIIDDLGSKIIIYDKERTICDIIKNKNRIETQIYIEGLQNYFLNEKINLNKLSMYAKKMKISKKVQEIVALYTKP